METGLVIGGRYLLQRLIKQGQYCAVYAGVDQLFQRSVAVKSVPAAQLPTYKAAIRMMSQFSHPNIVSLYDLVMKPDRLYLIEEYIEGNDFVTLLQTQLPLYDVVDFGQQVCSALLYAGSSSHRICHGDLTPTAIFRDRRGYIRINNFALPSDIAYFTAWSSLGGEGAPLSDGELPWGVMSEGRQADDTRALGLLLYQLLTSHLPGSSIIEPPADGRLRFPRHIPPELCEVVARTVIRQHPRHITKVEVLHEELKIFAETLEPAVPVLTSSAAPQQAEAAYLQQFQPPVPGTGVLIHPLPEGQAGSGFPPPYRSGKSGQLAAIQMESSPTDLTVADVPIRPATTGYMGGYPKIEAAPEAAGGSSLARLLVIGLILFALFFIIGYLGGHFLIPH